MSAFSAYPPTLALLAAQPKLVTPVLQVVHRVITRRLLNQAGLKADEAESGAVTLIQRIGSAAKLNIHLHCLVLDGVYWRCIPRCRRLQAAVGRGMASQKLLAVQRVMPRDADFRQHLCADIDSAGTSPTRRLPTSAYKPTPPQQVVLKLKTPWRDGTTHLVMLPLVFMQRLAALVTRPRLQLIRLHGVLAPNAKLRALVVPREAEAPAQAAPPSECEAGCTHHRRVRLRLANLLKRVFEIDMVPSPNCGGQLKIIAVMLEAPKKGVVVDLSAVRFLASVGIRVLLAGAKAVQRRGGKLAIVVAGGSSVAASLEATGVDELIPVFKDSREAEAAVLG